MRHWLRRRVYEPLLAALREGVTPAGLAHCVAVGAMIGIFPAIGTTTLLCTAAALALRLNMVVILAVNYLVYPLQFALLIPFFRAGEWLFGAERLSLSAGEVVALVRDTPIVAIDRLWTVTWHAAAAWLVLTLLTVPLIRAALTPAFRRMARLVPPAPGATGNGT
ncbi:MAG: DUF2062 domain-containing protein [Gemmatimonadetes bacterium]|nr:DUF2062 domain-containing protein [Gemmatimonadota bacterium]